MWHRKDKETDAVRLLAMVYIAH